MRSICHFHISAASKRKRRHWLPSSGQCAHSFGVDSLPQSGAQHRGLAPWCCRDVADVAKAASDGFALVETGQTAEFVAASAACRPTRFTRCSRRARPLSCLPSGTFRSRVRQHGVSVGLRRGCARPPRLPPASPFAPTKKPANCHAHPFQCLQGLIHGLCLESDRADGQTVHPRAESRTGLL